MRYGFGLASAFALGLALMAGCSDENGGGGTGGTAGTGGTGGSTGQVFPCTRSGIVYAIFLGGGPHTFACGGPTTVGALGRIFIGNDVILDGEGNLTVDSEHGPVFSVAAGITAELRGFTVSNSDGGGIYNDGTLTLTNSTVSGNSAGQGGGIDNYGTLTLIHSTVSGNSAAVGGGGIFNLGTVTLTNSTVSGNTAEGVYSGGGIFNAGRLTLTNSTVSGNTTLDNVGGGIFNDGTLTLTNTLVDNDCAGATVSGGGNLESPGNTCGFDQPTDQVNVTAEQLKLGPLQDNGGPTMTHALLPGSVAIDVIPEADCVDAEGAPLTTDQRGEPRPETGGTLCDVGAFEVQP
jgi:hypothetical protein